MHKWDSALMLIPRQQRLSDMAQLVREAGKYRLLGNVTRGGREVGVSLRLATGLRLPQLAEYNLELTVFSSLTK